ncbi:MAG: BlaI/MecI/CopY family transcriptional regulator [Candidatus Eremiobacteraeota bacterium]|nr:BlaI/MecI/CopY family transcriptional regulator [Candidatus Eremiobacteraeota bacterium]
MGRKPSAVLTDHELRIMRALWKLGESTNMDVVGALDDPPLARNTVMTTLGVLEKKGYVKHRADGRTFIYYPVVHEDDVQERALDNVLHRFFDGSPELLVSKLLDAEHISKTDRKRIQALLDRAKGS